MDPHPDNMHWLCCKFVAGIAETLKDSADISKVESVMRLIRGWLQTAKQYIVIDPKSHFYKVI